ncbi:hypothetical protein MHBO_001640 [Bonamia ostreae]|uniref:Uncharacterized protein n=1 Tax=Bonamia ostreae TaxID=126728 RepID=A0ABV2AJQ3_9EUKA
MEKVLHAKVQDLPIESKSIFKPTKPKSYTFKGVTKFITPRSESLIEIKPGTPFLIEWTNRKTLERGWKGDLPIALKRLLQKLPPKECVQGIPVSSAILMNKIINCRLSVDGQNIGLASKKMKTVYLNEEAGIGGDLFSQRRVGRT